MKHIGSLLVLIIICNVIDFFRDESCLRNQKEMLVPVYAAVFFWFIGEVLFWIIYLFFIKEW